MARTDFIIHAEDQGITPRPGFYQIKVCRGGVDRALSIQFNNGIWLCFLDGYALAPASRDWKAALGRFGNNDLLFGVEIDAERCAYLVKARQRDVTNGLDIDGPIDINQTQPVF